jgi:hypothetical protein
MNNYNENNFNEKTKNIIKNTNNFNKIIKDLKNEENELILLELYYYYLKNKNKLDLINLKNIINKSKYKKLIKNSLGSNKYYIEHYLLDIIYNDDILEKKYIINIFKKFKNLNEYELNYMMKYFYNLFKKDELNNTELNKYILFIYLYFLNNNNSNYNLKKLVENKKNIIKKSLKNINEYIYNIIIEYFNKNLNNKFFTNNEIFNILLKYNNFNNQFLIDINKYNNVVINFLNKNPGYFKKYIKNYNKDFIIEQIYSSGLNKKSKLYNEIFNYNKTILYKKFPELEIEDLLKNKNTNKNTNIKLFNFYINGHKNLEKYINFNDSIDNFGNNLLFCLYCHNDKITNNEIKNLIKKYKPNIKIFNKYGLSIKFIDGLFDNINKKFFEEVYGDEYKIIKLTEYESNIINQKDIFKDYLLAETDKQNKKENIFTYYYGPLSSFIKNIYLCKNNNIKLNAIYDAKKLLTNICKDLLDKNNIGNKLIYINIGVNNGKIDNKDYPPTIKLNIEKGMNINDRVNDFIQEIKDKKYYININVNHQLDYDFYHIQQTNELIIRYPVKNNLKNGLLFYFFENY